MHGAACHGNVELLELLVRHGADVEARNVDGDTPIDLVEDPAPRLYVSCRAVCMRHYLLVTGFLCATIFLRFCYCITDMAASTPRSTSWRAKPPDCICRAVCMRHYHYATIHRLFRAAILFSCSCFCITDNGCTGSSLRVPAAAGAITSLCHNLNLCPQCVGAGERSF